jgi:ABC-2 type transport system ATP-binding protein
VGETLALEFESVTKRYGDRVALDEVDFTVHAGTVVGLLGPNGAGKSTLVSIASTVRVPDSGHCRVQGIDTARRPVEVRRLISVALQATVVEPKLTGREYLVQMARLSGLGSTAARERATDLVDALDLGGVIDDRVETYSGGTQRRLDLACTLAAEAQLLLLDEPTTGLDPSSRRTMWDIVRDGGGTAALLTTQYLEEADEVCDTVAVLRDGRLLVHRSTGELKSEWGVSTVRLSMGTAHRSRGRALLESTGYRIVESDDGLHVLAVDTPNEIRMLLDCLSQHDLPVDSMAIRPPTLDDAFRVLTTRPADP